MRSGNWPPAHRTSGATTMVSELRSLDNRDWVIIHTFTRSHVHTYRQRHQRKAIDRADYRLCSVLK